MTSEHTGTPDGGTPLPRILCDTAALAAVDDAAAGALWRLAESGRQLDANVVRLPPGHRVDTHREPDLDVMLLVLSGHGTLTAPDGEHPLPAGTLIWLPHGSTRSLAAGDDGLTYLTVHRRRPGMTIRTRDA
ncbi:cupin domain [Streptomyces sp. T12]|uniref:cupin domain-containing protein n=1 Tax=Streptomyces sp. T12 TaxID=477697 RepID=UPI00119CE685|nr:cupin domain-containing protein [Streptomyces sp. T12]TWD18843.1 cupin domain [Streptomyces sp. T12]